MEIEQNVPKYVTLYEEIKNNIVNGIYPIGEKLPSESEFMQQNNYSRQTVRKSLEMLKEKGYIYKVQGSGCFVKQALNTHNPKTKSVLLIVLFAEYHFFPLYVKAIEESLKEKGYTLTLKISNNSVEEEASYLLNALHGEYAGILLFPSNSHCIHSNLYIYKQIKQIGIPCILIGNQLPFSGFPSVGIDDYKGGFLATEHLIKKGHKKIGCIMSREYCGCMRFAGYQSAHLKNQLPMDSSYSIWYDQLFVNDIFSGESKNNLLHKFKDVTGVFCFNDDIAMRLINLLESEGYSIPQDMSVMGFDNSYLCEIGSVKLSTINQNPFQIGKTVVENLIRMIQEPGFYEDHVFEPTVVERYSVKSLINSDSIDS